MKRIVVLGILLSVMAVLGFGESVLPIGGDKIAFSSTVLKSNTTISVGGNSFTFMGGKEISFYDDGSVSSGILAAERTNKIQGKDFLFKSGTVITFYKGGVVRSAYLSSSDIKVDINKDSVRFKSGMMISFDSEGNLNGGVLNENTTLKVGENSFTFKGGTAINFYGNQIVSKGYLVKNSDATKVGEEKIVFSGEKWISFYNDGTIKEATLGSDLVKKIENKNLTNTYTFKKGSIISFYPNGVVATGYLSKNVAAKVGDNSFVFSRVAFNQNQTIREGDLVANSKGTKVGNGIFSFQGGNLGQISFWADDTVRGGDLSANTVIKVGDNTYTAIGGIRFYQNGIEFYQSGAVFGFYLSKNADNIKVGNNYYTFIASKWIDFYENGVVMSGTLSDGTVASFDDMGNLNENAGPAETGDDDDDDDEGEGM